MAVHGSLVFTGKQIAGALRAMRSERACGVDHRIPNNRLNLPNKANDEITSSLTKREKEPAWPRQVMQDAVALLGTSATDGKPIFLTSLLFAVYIKIKKPVIAEFDRAHATWRDSAVAGNPCLREGIRRFPSEVACLNGNFCVDTFLDLQKFYNSIDNVRLIQQVCQLKRDPVVSYMSLLVHLFLHVLRIGDLWRECIQPCNSILQRCGSFNSWDKALLYSLLQDLHSRFPLPIGQQMDDINHHSHGTFFQALHFFGGGDICKWAEGLAALGLTLSQSKSTAVASHPRLLCAVRRELLEQRMSFENANSVRDVGLDATAVQRKSVKIQRKRERKSSRRSVHIKIIQNGLKQKQETKRLFQDGEFACFGLRTRWNGCVPELSAPQKGNGLPSRAASMSRPLAPRTSCISILARLEIQRCGSLWVNSERGSN